MHVSEITDREALEIWLDALPQGTNQEREQGERLSLALTHRAAMRVLPLYLGWSLGGDTRGRVSSALEVLRASLTAGVAAACPTLAIKHTASSIRRRALPPSSSAFTLGSAGARAAEAATAAYASLTASYSSSAGYAVGCASAAASAVPPEVLWGMIRDDCANLLKGDSLDSHALWPRDNPYGQLWIETRRQMLSQGDGWGFWVEWYENALRGNVQDWALLTQIALISSTEWDKGADHVNSLIAAIRLKNIAETRPLGEDLIAKGPDGLWHRIGQPDINRDILLDAADSVRDEIRRVRGKLQGPQGNMYTALIADIELLDERIAQYPDRPLRLHDTFLRVQSHIAHNLDTGELPEDGTVQDLSSVLSIAALDMRNACSRTKSVVSARLASRFAEANDDARADLARVADAIITLSDEELALEFRDDAATVADPVAPETEKRPALYRLTTRLSIIVTRDGKNVVDALVLLGGINGGLTAFTWTVNAILRFLV